MIPRTNGQRLDSALLLWSTLFSVSCQQPAVDIREWQPADHHNTAPAQARNKGQSDGKPQAREAGLDDVTITTWQNKCVSCHGTVGRGDGAQAPIFKPRDLTDPVWHQEVSDEQLLESIQKGRGKMPGFNLPEPTARNLVRLIRLMSRHLNAQPGTAASTPAPSASAGAPRESNPATATSAAAPGSGSAVRAPVSKKHGAQTGSAGSSSARPSASGD